MTRSVPKVKNPASRSASRFAKLSRPRLHAPVARERLFHLLDTHRQKHLTWISGPPGSGKTSLVSSWLDARGLPFRWYQVDSADRDPATFISFLVELGRDTEDITHSLPYFKPDHSADLATFARKFFRELFARLPEECVLVFDNCQDAAEVEFHLLLEKAAEQLPVGMTLIAVSREHLPVKMLRPFANRLFGTINWDDLRLSAVEAASILGQVTTLDNNLFDSVIRQSGGWAAGLILLAANARVRARGGEEQGLDSREALFAYFAGEVFDTASKAHKEILLRTALLPEVSPQSAVKLTDDPGAGEYLEQLHLHQYFTDRRVEPRLTYRYHDLFREFLLERARREYDSGAWGIVVTRAADELVESQNFSAAIDLYASANSWDAIAKVIVQEAESLMRQGRWVTLLNWLDLLPRSMVEMHGRLLFWQGMGRQVTDVSHARRLFENAIRIFRQEQDREGEAFAVSAVVDGYFQEWNTVVTLDPWLDALLLLLSEHAEVLSASCCLRARTSLLVGLLFRRPSDPALRDCVERVTNGLESERDPTECLRMMVYLLLYHDLMGEFPKAKALITRASEAIEKQDIAPRVRVWAIFRFAHHFMNAGDDDRALEEVDRALRIAADEGVDTLSVFLLICRSMILLNAGRALEAQVFVEQARPYLKPSRPMELVFFKWAEFSIAVATNNQSLSSALWDAFAEVPLIGVPHNTPYNHGTIFLLVQRGEISEAMERVQRWRSALSGMRSACLNFNLDIMQAYIQLQLDESAAIALLKSAFATASGRKFYGTLCWVPDMMRPLLALALREDIEPRFVSDLIRRKGLHPPTDCSRWPWAVRILALGQFSVYRNDEPLQFARRPQYRPLALLQAIIASGDSGAPVRRLIADLWPDSEGDAAASAFNTAVHRLRKLLGNDSAIVVNQGRVKLNDEVCWVDARAFERASGEILAQSQGVHQGDQILRLYGGHFLGDDVDTPWAIAYRDRLRAKFQRLVVAVGRQLEAQAHWECAADHYRQSLDVDNIHEEAYRRLMICLREQGEMAAAKQTYRRCRDLLSMVLGLAPSRETTAVFESLG